MRVGLERKDTQMEKEVKIYKEFSKDMILRDYLARDRTKLANERTLLAYFRTFIGFLASGCGLVKLFEAQIFVIIGYGMMVVSPIFLVLGIINYIFTKNKLHILDDGGSVIKKDVPSGVVALGNPSNIKEIK